jgi:hypothetical protein
VRGDEARRLERSQAGQSVEVESLRAYAALVGLEIDLRDAGDWLPETLQLLDELRRLASEDLGRQGIHQIHGSPP